MVRISQLEAEVERLTNQLQGSPGQQNTAGSSTLPQEQQEVSKVPVTPPDTDPRLVDDKADSSSQSI